MAANMKRDNEMTKNDPKKALLIDMKRKNQQM